MGHPLSMDLRARLLAAIGRLEKPLVVNSTS